ncbi:hypothetical protein STHU_25210 [Allostella humosa]|nr:hypothetical protein STHU_25210 [Stella humosa]
MLFELSQQEDDCSGLLSRLVTIRAVAEERPSLLRQFQSIAEIEAAFTKLDRCWRVPLLQWSAKRQIAEVALPPPPIPGTDIIRPLDTVQAMLREGETQNNCTDQHLARVLLGQCYLYAVHAPVRATVLVARDHADRWTLAEMIAADGDPVEGQALDEIRTWIMRSQGIECPLRQPADN